MKKPLLVGITGCSASGKTYFLNQLVKQLGPEHVSVLSQDNYYRPREHQISDSNGVVNFDLPSAIDDLALAKDLSLLKKGITIEREEYTFNNPNAVPKLIITPPKRIIVIEGIFVFHFKEVYQQLDLKVFIDADENLMLKRRIQRDAVERGYDRDDVIYRFKHHVIPMYRQYILPYRKKADCIIENNESGFMTALTELKDKIQERVNA